MRQPRACMHERACSLCSFCNGTGKRNAHAEPMVMAQGGPPITPLSPTCGERRAAARTNLAQSHKATGESWGRGSGGQQPDVQEVSRTPSNTAA